MTPPVLAFADLLEHWGLECDPAWIIKEALRQEAEATTQLNLKTERWAGMPERSNTK